MSDRPPLRARLHRYLLNVSEFALLSSMCEHCSDGSMIWASVARLAAYSKLSERQVQRLIRGFCDRGILSQIAPENTARRRPVTYRLNELAMEDDPKMAPYLARQGSLPGIRRPVPGEPIPDRDLVTPCHQSRDKRVADLVTPCHQSGDTMSPDSKAFDPRPNPKPVIHHGAAALNKMPAWVSFKEQLRAELSEEEWNLWVRPMLLLKAMPIGEGQTHLLAAIPPNSRIRSAAQQHLPMMRELLAPAGLNISLTVYPTEWEVQEAEKRYGIDMAPKPWSRN